MIASRATACGLLLVFGWSSVTFGERKNTAADARAKKITEDKVAHFHYQAGETLFRDGRYRSALAEFKKGFALTARPAFLINIGQCQRKLGELEEAKENFVTFLEADPNSPLAEQARTVLREIEAELKLRPQVPKPSAEPTP